MESRTRQQSEPAQSEPVAPEAAAPAVQEHGSPTGRVRPVSGWIGVGVLATILVVGLTWSKWIPYVDRIAALSVDAVWDG